MSFSEWDKGVIDDIANVTKLAGYEFTKHIKYIDDGEIIAIRALNVKEGVLDLKEIKRISSEVSDSLIRSKLFKDEILLTYTGSKYGEVAMVDEDNKYHLAPNVAKITIDDNYYPYFYFCYFRSETFKFYLKNYGVGSGQPTIPMKFIRRIEVPIPSLEEQINIAEIIKSIDKKIEVNNQISKTIENMAQAIFKQWFVDFEFPNEDGEPYKSSGGEMVESELGLIPLGWKVHLLKDFVPVITGKKNANVATNSGKYKFFTCSQIASKTDDYSFEGKAILVAGNGDFNVKFYNGKFEAYQRTYVLIPHKEDLSGFIYYMMDYNLEEIVTNARGSVISYLTKGDLEDSKIAFPEKENHIQYTVIFQIINEFILNLNKENEKLSELRDTLLPKLMSGEIRVPLDSEGDVS